jgi:hypothetical protein
MDDSVWFVDLFLDYKMLRETALCVCFEGRSKRVGYGLTFESIPEHSFEPIFFFTNLRNVHMKAVGDVLMYSDGKFDDNCLSVWFDGTWKFYADVRVMFKKKDITSDDHKIEWAEFWKKTVLEEGEEIFNISPLFSRLLFVHRKDMGYIQRCLLNASVNDLEINDVDRQPFAAMMSKMYAVKLFNTKRTCSFCGWFDGSRMKQCPCRSGMHYCSKICQGVHWRFVHKKECSRLFA